MTQMTKRVPQSMKGGLPQVRLPKSAAFEVSTSELVLACVSFKQAKDELLRFLGEGATVENADQISIAVYDLANQATRQRSRGVGGRTLQAVARGERLPFKSLVALAVKGKKKFTIDNVIDGLKRQKTMPESKNIRMYVATALKTYEDTFERIERGLYRMKPGASQRLVLKRKPGPKPKQLPAAPATA